MIACPKCQAIQPLNTVNTGERFNCFACRTQLQVEVFNAFMNPVTHGNKGESVQEAGQAECFYHPGKKAVVPCSVCGRLLCALCEVKLEERSLCLGCLQSGQKKQKIIDLEHQRPLYDSMALALAFWPIFMFFFPTLITAPAAIYVVLRYWKSAGSILPRSRFRYLLAMLLAGGQIVIWCLFFAGLVV